MTFPKKNFGKYIFCKLYNFLTFKMKIFEPSVSDSRFPSPCALSVLSSKMSAQVRVSSTFTSGSNFRLWPQLQTKMLPFLESKKDSFNIRILFSCQQVNLLKNKAFAFLPCLYQVNNDKSFLKRQRQRQR